MILKKLKSQVCNLVIFNDYQRAIMLLINLIIKFQCGDPTSLDVVAENASMVAVLTGGCHLASTEEAATIVDTASPNSNNDLLEVNPVHGSVLPYSCFIFVCKLDTNRCPIHQILVSCLVDHHPLSSATTRFTCFHCK